jgi:heme-degrading monooxygenase HmoA
MWARLTRFVGLGPERIEQAVQEFEQQQLPAIEQQEGFAGVYVMVDVRGGLAAALTLWESQDALKASDQLADQARDAAIETAGPDRPPLIDRYEIVLNK